MINNENIMYMYCNVLGQTEPEKILDIGLFYRQIGGVSRTILNSDVPKKCFMIWKIQKITECIIQYMMK